MINIPLPFYAMWLILFAGVLTQIFWKVKKINDNTPDNVEWYTVWSKFWHREWPTYGMALIAVTIIAWQFHFIKKFSVIENPEISKYGKWIPLSVLGLYALGILINWILYRFFGRIESGGKIDVKTLVEPNETKP